MSIPEKLYITRIVLENFRIHKQLDINFKDLNILIGENGAGKSSILEAICYCLFGVTASGAKKNELIKHGEKKGSVTLYLSNGYILYKDFSNKSKMIDDKGNVVTEKSGEIEYFLNMDKNIFLNILYSAQNDIYTYFLKFNAKEKDFLDNIFNLDNLTDNIFTFLKNTINELKIKYQTIQSNLKNIQQLKDIIKNLLESYKFESIESLERAVEVSKYNFQELSKKNMLFQQRESIKKNLETNERLLLSINEKIKELENALNDKKELEIAKKTFLDYIHKVEQDLKVDIDISNLQSLYKMFDDNTNIKNHLNYIKRCTEEGLNNLNDSGRIEDLLKTISSETDIILLIDEYRTYYLNIKNNITRLTKNIEVQVNKIEFTKSSLNREKMELDKVVREIRKYEEELKKSNSINNNSINDVKAFTDLLVKNQAQYTQLNTTLQNIKSYQHQLDSIILNGNEDDLKKIENQISSIEKISELFNRDGFVSYLRRTLLKEVALSISDSLEKFGFTKLTPVSIDEKDGALLFHNRPFRSLSGGEKTITGILMRVLYSKILAPNMKLGLLLMDEPTADLDSTRVTYLRQLLDKINKSLNMQIIVVTHDSELVTEDSNKIII